MPGSLHKIFCFIHYKMFLIFLPSLDTNHRDFVFLLLNFYLFFSFEACIFQVNYLLFFSFFIFYQYTNKQWILYTYIFNLVLFWKHNSKCEVVKVINKETAPHQAMLTSNCHPCKLWTVNNLHTFLHFYFLFFFFCVWLLVSFKITATNYFSQSVKLLLHRFLEVSLTVLPDLKFNILISNSAGL